MSACIKPYTNAAGQAFGCGQCLPCRFNSRRVWTHRLILESKQHEHNAFITLTYDDNHLPAGGSLDPKECRYWLDRMRKRVGYSSLRFYLVGEYGDLSFRPHYHVALFGFPCCEFGETRLDLRRRPLANCCQSCTIVHETWARGNIFVGELSIESAQYVAGYVTKKMTSKFDERLGGRYPEFSRQSRMPGIGAGAADDIASELLKFNLEQRSTDVPSELRYNRRKLPLGRYMKRKIRERIGRDLLEPKEVQLRRSEEMCSVREIEKRADPDQVKQLKEETRQAKAASMIARDKIRTKRKDTL